MTLAIGSLGNALRERQVEIPRHRVRLQLSIDLQIDLLLIRELRPATLHFSGQLARLLSGALSRIPKLNKPLLIHSDGGVGKTVFLQSLAKVLGETHETVLFDCFGGGAYRVPEDGRHLPKRGLIHIINNLASHGLCDPLLPINENVEELVKAFRLRVGQAVATLQRGSTGAQKRFSLLAVNPSLRSELVVVGCTTPLNFFTLSRTWNVLWQVEVIIDENCEVDICQTGIFQEHRWSWHTSPTLILRNVAPK